MPYIHPTLSHTIEKDKTLLAQTKLPIVTVSAAYIEDLKGLHDLPETDTSTDIVFSRAHYSMALAAAIQAWGETINPDQAWLVDPTNYVKAKNWSSVTFTEAVGKLLARTPLLKKLKDLADKFARNKLPILNSITPPLLYLTQKITQPVLSMHIASGNILAEQGKQVYQMVTDPHVRQDYLNQAQRKNITFLVFDENTKTAFLQQAKQLNKKVSPDRVIVTGPPIDPRIIAYRQAKQPWTQGILKLCLTTGGLGTNKKEIKQILQQLLPELKKPHPAYQLMMYAGTHHDLYKMAKTLADQEAIIINEIGGNDPADYRKGGRLYAPTIAPAIKNQLEKANFSLIYHPQIVDANELLTHFAFPWADGFISKPSGDMAYDAAASGSFLLTLQEWGEWEHNIRKVFEKLGIAQKAQPKNIIKQLKKLMTVEEAVARKEHSWIEQAMTAAQKIDPLFLNGTKKIVHTVKSA